MDPREQMGDHLEALHESVQRHVGRIWTAMPATVNKWDYPDTQKNTVSLTVGIKGRERQQDGTHKDVSMPELQDVPVHFLGGANYTLTTPLKKGVQGIVLFSSRCLDAWWQNADDKNPDPARPDYGRGRKHSLSDGMFIPGLNSVPKTLKNISTTSSQLRSDDGKSYIEMLDNGGGMNFITDGHFLKWIGTTGDLHVSGKIIAGYGGGDQIGLQSHTHAQPNDSAGDIEAETKAPTAGT